MGDNKPNGLTCLGSGKSTLTKPAVVVTGNMARDDRRAFVLAVLEDSGVAMKSVDVFRNCKLRGAMFEHRTTKTYLADLMDSGDVLKVDSQALGEGEIVEVDSGERGHFIAASAAKAYQERE